MTPRRPANKSLGQWVSDGMDFRTVVFIFIQIVTIVWFQASLSSRVTALELKDNIPRTEVMVRDRAFDDSLAEIKGNLLRMEDKLDKLNERR